MMFRYDNYTIYQNWFVHGGTSPNVPQNISYGIPRSCECFDCGNPMDSCRDDIDDGGGCNICMSVCRIYRKAFLEICKHL